MVKEKQLAPERQLEVLESLKPRLGRFFEEKVFVWGLQPEDCRLVDEVGFGYTGIPIFGPELSGEQPHIDISVKADKYTGPKSSVTHPFKINLPVQIASEISNEYGIGVWDFIRGSDAFFTLPTVTIRLGNVDVLVPEPAAHVRAFANETILCYTEEQVGEDKLEEWFNKLKMIRDVSQHMLRTEVQQIAKNAIEDSRKRWGEQGFHWLSNEGV